MIFPLESINFNNPSSPELNRAGKIKNIIIAIPITINNFQLSKNKTAKFNIKAIKINSNTLYSTLNNVSRDSSNIKLNIIETIKQTTLMRVTK